MKDMTYRAIVKLPNRDVIIKDLLISGRELSGDLPVLFGIALKRQHDIEICTVLAVRIVLD